MNTMLVLAALTALLLALALIVLFRKLLSPAPVPVTVDWIRNFSSGRYRPMERLLQEADYRFLASQPGFSRKLAWRLRIERRRTFRRYLQHMRRDFNRLCTAVKFLMVHSQLDRPDLASILLKQQVLFTLALALVQSRLILHTVGIGTVDVSRLVKSLEFLGAEVRGLETGSDLSFAVR